MREKEWMDRDGGLSPLMLLLLGCYGIWCFDVPSIYKIMELGMDLLSANLQSFFVSETRHVFGCMFHRPTSIFTQI